MDTLPGARFFRVTWNDAYDCLALGPAMRDRTRHGLWLVDCPGFAVLVLNDVFHQAFKAGPQGAAELRDAVRAIMRPNDKSRGGPGLSCD